MLVRRHIFLTFLLVIWSTSRTIANTTHRDHNLTSKNPSPVTVGTNHKNVTSVELRDNITNVGASLANSSANVPNTNFLDNVTTTTNASVDVNATNADVNATNVDVNASNASVDVDATTNVPTPEESANILRKIHRTVTRSKDAVWATLTLTFMCVLLLLAVAQSKMWKDHHFTESQGVPLPDFNERVLFRDVMEHKLKTLKRFFKKKKKKEDVTEMESLLASGEQEEDEDVVFQKDFSYRR